MSGAKARVWWLHYPGLGYAITFHFSKPVGEREVRADARGYFRVRKLPNETAVGEVVAAEEIEASAARLARAWATGSLRRLGCYTYTIERLP